jgi:hypothetical protein
MDSLDQAAEWRRLQEIYAHMNEGELEVVAQEAYNLTEIARPLLRDEIARRGLKIPLVMERTRPRQSAPPPVDPSRQDLIVAQTFWDIADARGAQQQLNAASIPCFWGPENLDSPDRLPPGQGLDLVIRDVDRPRVRTLLNELIAVPDSLEDFEMLCPKCKSPEILFHDVDETKTKFHWSCDACGNEWSDDGVSVSP